MQNRQLEFIVVISVVIMDCLCGLCHEIDPVDFMYIGILIIVYISFSGPVQICAWSGEGIFSTEVDYSS